MRKVLVLAVLPFILFSTYVYNYTCSSIIHNECRNFPNGAVIEYDTWRLALIEIEMAEIKQLVDREIENFSVNDYKIIPTSEVLQSVYDPIYYQSGFAYERCGFIGPKESYTCDILFEDDGGSFLYQNNDCKVSYPISFIIEAREYFLFEELECRAGLKLYEKIDNKIEFVRELSEKNLFDPTPIIFGNDIYIFGTSYDGELLFSRISPQNLLNKNHRMTFEMVTTSSQKNRFAGPIFTHQKNLYGFTMNNENVYGKSLNLVEIALNPNSVSVKVIATNVLRNLNLFKYHTFSFDPQCDNETCSVMIDFADRHKRLLHGTKVNF